MGHNPVIAAILGTIGTVRGLFYCLYVFYFLDYVVCSVNSSDYCKLSST